MRRARSTCVVVLACLAMLPTARRAQEATESPLARGPEVAFRVFSWNVSGSRFFEYPDDHRALIRLADPDILLLDEMQGGRNAAEIGSVLPGIRDQPEAVWNVMVGTAGGYQRGVIVSRYPMERVTELDGLPYPQAAVARLESLVPDPDWRDLKANLDAGIATTGAAIRIGERSVLAVVLDLQCCNGTPDWQEARRQIEAREIKSAIRNVLARRSFDAILVAGDFNLVSSARPLVIIGNPYPAPHFGLVPADAVQLDGTESWTWDGRDSPFPSRALDFSLYSPVSLEPLRAVVLSTEDLSTEVLSSFGLDAAASRRLSDHLPIVVDYRWR